MRVAVVKVTSRKTQPQLGRRKHFLLLFLYFLQFSCYYYLLPYTIGPSSLRYNQNLYETDTKKAIISNCINITFFFSLCIWGRYKPIWWSFSFFWIINNENLVLYFSLWRTGELFEFTNCINSRLYNKLPTLFHTESLIGFVGPHLRLFLMFNMLPLERTVLKENVLIALFQNKSWNKYLISRVAGQYPNSGRRYILPLDGAAYLNYWPLWGSYFSGEVLGKSSLLYYFLQIIFDFI